MADAGVASEQSLSTKRDRGEDTGPSADDFHDSVFDAAHIFESRAALEENLALPTDFCARRGVSRVMGMRRCLGMAFLRGHRFPNDDVMNTITFVRGEPPPL